MPGVCPIKISHSLKHIEVQKIVLNKHNLSIKEKITKNGHNHQNCSSGQKLKDNGAKWSSTAGEDVNCCHWQPHENGRWPYKA
jgi:hypothetical protein